MNVFRTVIFCLYILLGLKPVNGQKNLPSVFDSAITTARTSDQPAFLTFIKSDNAAQIAFEQGKINEKQLQAHYEASRARVEKMVSQHPNNPFVLIGAANSALQRAHGLADPSPQDERQFLDYANRAASMARRQNNPEALELALRTSAIGKYYSGDYPGATADAKAALSIDRKDPVAATVIAAIGGRDRPVGLIRESRGVPGKPGAGPAAMPSGPRTPQEWAAGQNERPSEAGALIAQSMKSLKTGNLQDALKLAGRAADSDPRDPMAWSQRALVEYRGKQFDQATADASRAIQLGWKWPPLFDIRAKSLLLQAPLTARPEDAKKLYREALEDADAAIGADPQYASAYRTRGWAKLRLGLPPSEVLSDFQRAAAADPAFQEDFRFAAQVFQDGNQEALLARLAESQGAPRRSLGGSPGAARESGDSLVAGRPVSAYAAGGALLAIGVLSVAFYLSRVSTG